MSYRYEDLREAIFTEEGQRLFLYVRDTCSVMIRQGGAVRMDALLEAAGGGDTWQKMACVDRMVELGELKEIPNSTSSVGQHRIFTDYRTPPVVLNERNQ